MRGDQQAAIVGALLPVFGAVLAVMALAGAPDTQAWHVVACAPDEPVPKACRHRVELWHPLQHCDALEDADEPPVE